MTASIRTAGLVKIYRLYARPVDRLLEMLQRRPRHTDILALDDVSLEVQPGHTVGVIGRNGSGKSTLLEILAGTVLPTHGSVMINGRVSALLELGAGFNPEFTGRENVFLTGAILGVSNADMRRRFQAIADFASIGDFMDRPVKIYSSGMTVRLAFSVAISVDPDVLLVDEALAVGDARFQQRCMRRIHALRETGKTIFFVSHDAAAIANLCDQAILLENGRVLMSGDPDAVLQRYNAIIYEGAPPSYSTETAPRHHHVTEQLQFDHRFGDRRAELIGFSLCGSVDRPTKALAQGEKMRVLVQSRFLATVSNPIVGVLIRDRLGVPVFGLNTGQIGAQLPASGPGESLSVTFDVDPPILHPGSYSLSIAVADGDLGDHSMCDWMDNVLTFEVTGRQPVYGVLRPDARVFVQRHDAHQPSKEVVAEWT